jgi:ABC-type transport system substrate-binding protein
MSPILRVPANCSPRPAPLAASRFLAETTPGYGAEWMDAVQIAVKNWKAAGIQAEIRPKEYDAFVSSAIYGKFDKMMLGAAR